MERNRFPSSREELEYEIEDLQGEINRQQLAVSRIRIALDIYETNSVANNVGGDDLIELVCARVMLRKIRNIVG